MDYSLWAKGALAETLERIRRTIAMEYQRRIAEVLLRDSAG